MDPDLSHIDALHNISTFFKNSCFVYHRYGGRDQTPDAQCGRGGFDVLL
jgi:hypothetical protein